MLDKVVNTYKLVVLSPIIHKGTDPEKASFIGHHHSLEKKQHFQQFSSEGAEDGYLA